MNTESSTVNAGRRITRALCLQGKTAAQSIIPSDCMPHGCAIEIATYGGSALSHLLRREFDVIVACAEQGHTEATSAFLLEIKRAWPWMEFMVIGSSFAPETERLAKDIGTKCILFEPVSAGQLCESIRKAAAPVESNRGQDASQASHLLDQRVARELGLMAQNAMEAPTLSGVLGHISRKLSEFLPSSMVCTLGIADENVLDVATRVPVNAALLSAVQNEALARYYGLVGVKPNTTLLRVQHGHVIDGSGGPSNLARVISMPVMDDEEVVGLLTMADPENHTPFTHGEISVFTAASIHISAILSALKAVKRHASRDPMTGVLNRTGLKDELERAWFMSQRYDFPMTIVLLDIDSFKLVNDSYGHSAGDRVICEFAQLISGTARSSDIIARYGGDEFVIVLMEADDESTRVFSERLLGIIREHLFCSQDERLKMTASIGIASAKSAIPASTANDLFNRADRALYAAKWEGRNRACYWQEEKPNAGRNESPLTTGSITPKQPSALPAKLMAVDDDATILYVIQYIMEAADIGVETFTDAKLAIQRLTTAGKDEFSVIVTDLEMPGKNGLQFLHEINAINESAVRMVMTGFATVESTVSSLREGVYDVIRKPFTADDFRERVKKALAYFMLKVENTRFRDHLQELVVERSAQLSSSLEELRNSHEFTLDALVAMLDAREYQTARHSLRARELAVALAERVGFTEKQIESLAKGALLHDIGKISIPDSILLKPGPLLPEEWEIMKRHPDIGYQILSTGFHMKEVAELVRSHHEHYDGAGYPLGLKGKDIPIAARVFSLVDAYEAMTSQRAYRAAMPVEEAISRIKKGSGTQFDPKIVDVMLKYRMDFLSVQ